SAARRIAPPGFLLGRSVDRIEDAEAAMWEGADYVGAGPVYPTGSKLDAGPVMGVEGIAAIRSQLGKLPLVAIGGVSEANAGEVAAAGADALAVISAVMQADDPAAATKALLEAVR